MDKKFAIVIAVGVVAIVACAGYYFYPSLVDSGARTTPASVV